MLTVLGGFVIALAIAVTGVGAGVITAPALILLLGLPPTVAVGTALAFATLVKIPALATYVRRQQVHWGTARSMIAWGVPGVVLGGVVLQYMAAADLRGAVLLTVGGVVISGGVLGLYRAWRPLERVELDNRVDPTLRRSVGLLSLPIGIEVGFSSAGAGALGTLLLLQRTRLDPATVVGTDLAFGLALAAVGGTLHLAYGTWDPALLLQLAAGGVLGAVVGARIAGAVPKQALRLALLTWLVVVGGHMTYKGLGEVKAQVGPIGVSLH